MRRLVVAILIVLAAALPGAVRADFEGSRAWFDGLAADDRSFIQANLTLLGHYEFLVDGRFGTGTYKAVTAFQQSIGAAATGILDPLQQQRLSALASAEYARLGMDLVHDDSGQAALIMPTSLLTETVATRRGHSYATADGGIALETVRKPIGEQSFRGLFEQLRQPGEGRSILYANYNDERFVVSGKHDGRSFYTLFQNAETDSVGYSLSWSEAHNSQARMLAIFIASHFTALRYLPVEQEERKITATPSRSQQFGVFTLPAGAPDVIMLNGEVNYALWDDFMRALDARPAARVLVLNSPGGLVDNALEVAREVHGRGMSTLVADGMGCYSACAYIYFAGAQRFVEGELGVHQISAEVADLVLAQTTLSDVLDALYLFGVQQKVVSVMLRTPPEEMYVFTTDEVATLGINVGGPVRLASLEAISDIDPNPPADSASVIGIVPDPATSAYIQLSLLGSEEEANRSLAYAVERWSVMLEGVLPELARDTSGPETVYRVRVPARSVEHANALCAAIQSAGGGCFVTRA